MTSEKKKGHMLVSQTPVMPLAVAKAKVPIAVTDESVFSHKYAVKNSIKMPLLFHSVKGIHFL